MSKKAIKAYGGADRWSALHEKRKRSKKKIIKCTKGCYVLRVYVPPYVTPFCNTNLKIYE